MKIEIKEWSLSREEIQSALWLQYREARRRLGIWLAALVLLFSGLLYGGLRYGNPAFLLASVLLGLAGLYLAYIRFYHLPYRLPCLASRSMAEIGPLQLVVDDDGILEIGRTAEAFHRWDAVHRISEDSHGFLFDFIGGLVLYVPRRLLTEEQMQYLHGKLKNPR